MKRKEVIFTDRELDVMGVLWDDGSATVAEVKDKLTDRLAYTTVLTILRTLEEKGHVGHKAEGRAYRYYPLVELDRARKNALERLTRKLFDGSSELLMSHLVAKRSLSEDELQSMRKILNQEIKNKRS